MPRTALEAQLAGEGEGRPTALDAFKLARRWFIAGERIEMTALARELGVSRVTLNRWVGSRDLLLGEVLWSLGGPALDRVRERVSTSGPDAVAEVMEGFLADVLAEDFMRQFLAREPEIALRILTTSKSRFQAQLVARLREILSEEMGEQDLPLALDDLAFLMARIGESFIYVDIIAGGVPDPRKAGQAIRALLT